MDVVHTESTGAAVARGEDYLTESARLRDSFVDHVWLAGAIFCAVVLVCLPLRALTLHTWSSSAVTNIALAGCFAGAFPLRRRLPANLRAVLPPGLLMVGAIIGTFKNGLEDIGLVLLMAANVQIALLFSRRIAFAAFAITCLVLIIAGLGFVSHRAPVLLSPDYATSWVGWTFATATFLSLGFLLVNGILTYRQATEALSRRVVSQRDEIAAQRDQIAVLATHDSLTGLPNRRLANDRLEMACRRAARAGESVGILFVDLDEFKAVNDRLGHDAGDSVLRTVATRLTQAIRAADTAARLGGDEFLIILGSDVRPEAAMQVCRKLAEEIARPILHRNEMVTLSASIGFAIYPDDGVTPDDLLRRADEGMYASKRSAAAAWRSRTPN